MGYECGIVAVYGGKGVKEGCEHIFFDVLDFGCVVFDAIDHKFDMAAVEFKEFVFYYFDWMVFSGYPHC